MVMVYVRQNHKKQLCSLKNITVASFQKFDHRSSLAEKFIISKIDQILSQSYQFPDSTALCIINYVYVCLK